jgi:hypothetical protein
VLSIHGFSPIQHPNSSFTSQLSIGTLKVCSSGMPQLVHISVKSAADKVEDRISKASTPLHFHSLFLIENIHIHSFVFSLHGLQLRPVTLWRSLHSKLTIFFILPTATLPTAGNMDNAEAEYISRCHSDETRRTLRFGSPKSKLF